MDFEVTEHARDELARRSIPSELLREVLLSPQQIVPTYGNRVVYQSQVYLGEGRTYLLRAVVDDNVQPAEVVTVYKTSKISKYWSY